jgi:hypothetical protein
MVLDGLAAWYVRGVMRATIAVVVAGCWTATPAAPPASAPTVAHEARPFQPPASCRKWIADLTTMTS